MVAGYADGPMGVISDETSDDGVHFTTFVQSVKATFVPELNDEHSAWIWAKPDALPEPMHPGPLATIEELGDWLP